MLGYFLNPNAYATTLLTILIDAFGTECFDWEDETIRLEVQEFYKTEILEENMDKILSAVALMTTDGFYTDVNQFIATCNTLSGADRQPGVFDPATVEECAWAVTEATLLDPQTEIPFSVDIMTYLGVRLNYEGWSKSPKVLEMALLPNGEATAEEFTGDSVLFAGVWGTINENEDELKEQLNRNKQELINQLQSLKLKNGSFDNIISNMQNKEQEIV